MAFFPDLCRSLSVTGKRRMVAWSDHRPDSRRFRAGRVGEPASGPTFAHGQRAARPGIPQHARTSRISRPALRCADTAHYPVLARGVRRHPGRLLSFEVASQYSLELTRLPDKRRWLGLALSANLLGGAFTLWRSAPALQRNDVIRK